MRVVNEVHAAIQFDLWCDLHEITWMGLYSETIFRDSRRRAPANGRTDRTPSNAESTQ